MSAVGIGALERGDRRTPQRETVALLAKALGLSPSASTEFAAAAARSPRRKPAVDAKASAGSDNLPPQLTSFIGRQREVGEIAALLATRRLVTLVGSGGIGKSRISLEVAARTRPDWSDGVWLVELAPLASGEYVPSTVARALGMTLACDSDPLDDLVRALAAKQMLLVFDNCEHLIESAALVASAILRSCPRVTVLASGRQGLGIAGEETYRLKSLDLPPDNELQTLGARDALGFEAIALFVERARTVDKNFALSDDTAPDVARICRQLDGLPLAIELAASRVNVLSPRQLRDRLAERFRLLISGSRDAVPRHRTLQGLIDWSHDLLDERERVLFRRLSIFTGSFTLDGAAGIFGSNDVAEFEILDVLAGLVDKSLVLAETGADVLRYRLLESTRAYAWEKLVSADEGETIAVRHLGYLRCRFAMLRERMERTARETERNVAFCTDLDDVRAALDAALRRADVLGGGALLAEIGDAWMTLGLTAEGVRRFETFLATLPGDESLLLARLSTALSGLLRRLSQDGSLSAAAQAVEYARRSGEDLELADALGSYAFAISALGRAAEADAALAEAEAIPACSTRLRLKLMRSRAFLAYMQNDNETAARIWEHLRIEHRTLGNARAELLAAHNLADAEHMRGQTRRAIALARETIAGLRRGTDTEALALALCNLGAYLAATDDLDGAAEAAYESIDLLAARNPSHGLIAWTMEHLALVHALSGDLTRAAKLEGYVCAVFERVGYRRERSESIAHDRLITLLGRDLTPLQIAQFAAEGAAHSPKAAIALAIGES